MNLMIASGRPRHHGNDGHDLQDFFVACIFYFEVSFTFDLRIVDHECLIITVSSCVSCQ